MEFFTFGERLGVYRRRKKLSKKELAEMVGVSVSTITNYENGKTFPDYETIENLARTLKVSINQLLEGFQGPDRERYSRGIL